MQKHPMEIHSSPTPNKKLHWVKRITSMKSFYVLIFQTCDFWTPLLLVTVIFNFYTWNHLTAGNRMCVQLKLIRWMSTHPSVPVTLFVQKLYPLIKKISVQAIVGLSINWYTVLVHIIGDLGGLKFHFFWWRLSCQSLSFQFLIMGHNSFKFQVTLYHTTLNKSFLIERNKWMRMSSVIFCSIAVLFQNCSWVVRRSMLYSNTFCNLIQWVTIRNYDQWYRNVREIWSLVNDSVYFLA